MNFSVPWERRTFLPQKNANCGYQQDVLVSKERNMTTFTICDGLFRFNRMLFGRSNVSATFQRSMNIILSGVKWKFALFYVDDGILFSTSNGDHFTHLRADLRLLQWAGNTLKLKTCFIFQASVDY